MAAEENKALMRRWFDEVWCQRRADAIDRMLAPDAKIHGIGEPGVELRGPEGFRPFHAKFLEAFGELDIAIEDMVAEGESVAVRWTLRVKHTGDSLGFAATHRTATASGMTIVRFKNGVFTEGWNNWDLHGLLTQLGAPIHQVHVLR